MCWCVTPDLWTCASVCARVIGMSLKACDSYVRIRRFPPTLTRVTEIIDSDWITTVTSHTHTHERTPRTHWREHTTSGPHEPGRRLHTDAGSRAPWHTLINIQVHAWAAHEPSCHPNVERIWKESAQWMHLSVRCLWVLRAGWRQFEALITHPGKPLPVFWLSSQIC